MGDFERTFGAGADAASIIDAFSNQEEDIDSITPRTSKGKKGITAEERAVKAKQRGVKIYWRARDDVYADAVYPGLPIRPDFLAFDYSTKKNNGRVYRIGGDLWGWSMYAHSITKSVPFRTYGATGSRAEADSFMAEAYGLLLEHNRTTPRFSFFVNPDYLGSPEPSISGQDSGDPRDLEIEIDSKSNAVVRARTWGHTLYVVISCGPRGNFGSVHPDIGNAIAAFSAQFDGWHENDGPMRPSYEPQITRAIAEILVADASRKFTPECYQAILYADTEISIAKVLMYGFA
jgi:hypothetical protein